VNRAGVLLDRDGTIIVDHGYVGSIERVEFIPGAIEAIARLNAAEIPVAVVTNQAGVARGFYDIVDVEQVHKHMTAELARQGAHVDIWLFCPYHPDGIVEAFAQASSDRKPGPGMAEAAAAALRLDLEKSWVVGDRQADVGLAHAVGAHPIYVGRPGLVDPSVPAFPDLAAAVDHILATDPAGPLSGQVAVPVPPPRFPLTRIPRADHFGAAYAAELARAMETIDYAAVAQGAELLAAAYRRDATVFACGNGGSASIANHLQCDHVKGIRGTTNAHNRVFSLSTNVELFSAIANDLGYDSVFEYQLQSLARPGDVLVAISSSGRSASIVRALDWAEANGVRTIALTGFDGEPSRSRATVSIHVEAVNYGIVEDAHQSCMHLLAQYLRQSWMTPDAVASEVF